MLVAGSDILVFCYEDSDMGSGHVGYGVLMSILQVFWVVGCWCLVPTF